MIEWLRAVSPEAVGKFYDDKYRNAGLDAFRDSDRSLYIQALEDLGGKMSDHKSIFDAGCGNGDFLSQVNSGMYRSGCDVSRVAISLAQKRLGSSSDLMVEDMEQLPAHLNGAFDYVTCFGSIEHCMDPVSAFKRLFGLVKNGGVMLISVPIEFENCLGGIASEKNHENNERFAKEDEWIRLFVQEPQRIFTVGSERKDLVLAYVKK